MARLKKLNQHPFPVGNPVAGFPDMQQEQEKQEFDRVNGQSSGQMNLPETRQDMDAMNEAQFNSRTPSPASPENQHKDVSVDFSKTVTAWRTPNPHVINQNF